MDFSTLNQLNLDFAQVEKLLKLNPAGTLPISFATQMSDTPPEDDNSPCSTEDSLEENQAQVGQKRKSSGGDRAEEVIKAYGSLKDRKTSVSDTGEHSHNEGSTSRGEDHKEDEGTRSKGKTTARRKEQNRNAQRAFRERKEKHLKELEDQVADLEKKNTDQVSLNQNLKDLVSHLQKENSRLKVYEAAFTFNFQSNLTSLASSSTPSSAFSPPPSISTSASSPDLFASLLKSASNSTSPANSPTSSRPSPPALGGHSNSMSSESSITSVGNGSINLGDWTSLFGGSGNNISSPTSLNAMESNNGLFDITPLINNQNNNISSPSFNFGDLPNFNINNINNIAHNSSNSSLNISDLFSGVGGISSASPSTVSLSTPPASISGLVGLGDGWSESLSELKSFTSYKPPISSPSNNSSSTNIQDFLSSLSSSTSLNTSTITSPSPFDFFGSTSSAPGSSPPSSILVRDAESSGILARDIDSNGNVTSDYSCPLVSQAKALGGESAGFTFDLDLLCSDLKAKATCSEKARAALAAAVNEDMSHMMK